KPGLPENKRKRIESRDRVGGKNMLAVSDVPANAGVVQQLDGKRRKHQRAQQRDKDQVSERRHGPAEPQRKRGGPRNLQRRTSGTVCHRGESYRRGALTAR